MNVSWSKLIQEADQFFSKEKWEQAHDKYTEALPLLPRSEVKMIAEVYNNCGVAKNNLGDHKGAIADCDKALELNPEYANAYNNRGIAKKSLNDYKGAIVDYDETIRINPDDKKAIHNRAVALALQLAEEQRKEIEEKYQEQLRAQQEEFEKKLEENVKSRVDEYEKNILKAGGYIERAKQYDAERERIEGDIKRCLEELQKNAPYVCGGVALAILLFVFISGELGIGIFPIVLLVGVILSPQFWRIRMLNRDKHKYWALREDAYTKGVLANLIDVEPEVRKELIGKFFDHHDKRGSAQLIADWARRENGGDGESAVNSVKNYLKPNKDDK